MKHALLSFIIVVSLWTGLASAVALEIQGRAHVSDGDTIKVDGLTIRLHGIDAPESAQTCQDGEGRVFACGQQATARLRALAEGKRVVCEGREFDHYKRLIAVCRTQEAELNLTMVREGYAWAFRRYSLDYVSVELEARREKKGVLAANNTPPWEFRAGSWQAASSGTTAVSNDNCPIKGNVSRSGERIYHMPWQRDYHRINMEGQSQKRWFCNENDAVAAGWRKALR